MEDYESMREAYVSQPAAMRMGHLASDLLRLSLWVKMGRDSKAVLDLMSRIAWLMEWNPEHASEELADMQREICRWRRIWPLEPAGPLLAFRAEVMSNRVLEASGLLDETAPVGTSAPAE